jgi:hypothetical protein
MLADFALVEMDLCIGTVRVHEEIRSYLERKNSEVMASIRGMLVDRIEESRKLHHGGAQLDIFQTLAIQEGIVSQIQYVMTQATPNRGEENKFSPGLTFVLSSCITCVPNT